MTTKSWVEVFLLLIIVGVGSMLATRYVLENNKAVPAALSSEISQTNSDQPVVQISKPDPVILNSWQGYDSAEIKCAQQGTDTSLPKGCAADFHISKKHIALPDLSSLAEVKDFDGASYAWVAQYENSIYVDIKGGNESPMGGSWADFIYIFDEPHNALTKIFRCDSYDCVQLAEPQANLSAYAHRVNDDQGVRIYRDFIYKGELRSSLVASVPKENNGWGLGTNCENEQCASGYDWITVLNQDNFVLRFDKRVSAPSVEGVSKVETKYVFVSMQ